MIMTTTIVTTTSTTTSTPVTAPPAIVATLAPGKDTLNLRTASTAVSNPDPYSNSALVPRQYNTGSVVTIHKLKKSSVHAVPLEDYKYELHSQDKGSNSLKGECCSVWGM